MTRPQHFSKIITESENDVAGLCRLMKMLANPNRLRILLFIQDNEASVGEIELSLLIRQPSLSHELKILRDAELVVTRRQSKVIFYSLKNDAVKTLLKSVNRALNESKQNIDDHRSTSLIGELHDLRAIECGLFANIHQHPGN